MAKFEVFLVLAKRKDNGEVYTDDLEYVCFCDDTYKHAHMSDATNELIQEEVNSSEDEVLFGSADVIVNKSTLMMMHYKNSDIPKEEINEIVDLLIDGSGRETVH